MRRRKHQTIPTCKKGDNQILSIAQKQTLIELALKDATHCRKSLGELVAESQINISISTISRVLATDRIHRRTATTKPYLNDTQKQNRLQFAQQYLHFDWTKVLFLDEAYFEPSALRSGHAKGVLRRAGEQHLPHNMNRKFYKGKSAMFWGGIMHGYAGVELLYYLFTNPAESKTQKDAATLLLQQELEWDLEDWAEYTMRGEHHTFPLIKKRSTKRKGGIDWFVYRQSILRPKVFPFLAGQMRLRNEILYFCEDNASPHISKYNVAECLDNGFTKIRLPSSSPDINVIEQVWNHIKRRVKERIGWDFTDARIKEIVVEEWLALDRDFINELTASVPRRLAAIIAANGGNEFEA